MTFRAWIARFRRHTPARSGNRRRSLHALQLDAARESARHARNGARAAWAGVIVNALVVGVALLVPAYQHSIDSIEDEMRDRRQAGAALKAGYDGLLAAQFLLGPDGYLDQKFCETIPHFDPRQTQQIEAIQANMSDDNHMRFKQAETELISGNQLALMIRLTRAISAAFEMMKYDMATGAPLKERQLHCRASLGLVAEDARELRDELVQAYRLYRRPLVRPFGILNGVPRSPDPIYMEENQELDASAGNIQIPQPTAPSP